MNMHRRARLIVAGVAIVGLVLGARVPQAAAGFCCKSVSAIKLTSTDPTVPVR